MIKSLATSSVYKMGLGGSSHKIKNKINLLLLTTRVFPCGVTVLNYMGSH
jgi:hypothetical protein